eukprot:CAMPEP_0113692716 /NCGR_PEP_ID=MMETSP0038_2-20120614/19251_1 /TAXON_ID=2898 /ORGANISM="Cryptomonas paramecium" /LENGTH=183 /DNA_ID=CAMNT_0000614683 /DNA_START=51 /DNA_END=599 /DNA_ORIENTATION=- /assembly_acc=CAM_ASM_000170
MGAAAAVIFMRVFRRQLPRSADALKNDEASKTGPIQGAIKALDEISSMLHKLSSHPVELGDGIRAGETVSRQAADLVESELNLLAHKVANLVSDSAISSLPLARLLRKGPSAAPRCAVDLGGTLNKVICTYDPAQPLKIPETAVHHTPPLQIVLGKHTLHLVCVAFASSRIGDVVDFLQSLLP